MATTGARDKQAGHEHFGSLWLALSIGPVIWALQAASGYVLVPYACTAGLKPVMHAITAAALLILVLTAWKAWGKWDEAARESPGDEDVENWPPERWMPASAFFLCVFFFAVTAMQGVYTLIMDSCK